MTAKGVGHMLLLMMRMNMVAMQVVGTVVMLLLAEVRGTCVLAIWLMLGVVQVQVLLRLLMLAVGIRAWVRLKATHAF